MLSIVMPVYNSSDTLMEAFNSALKSGVDQQEIILVDDGSTDESKKIIRNLESKYSFVKCIFNKKNMGGGSARNIGVKNAIYPLIFILDSDDILVEGSLAKAIEELQLHNADAIANSTTKMFTTSTKNIVRDFNYQRGFLSFESLVSHNPNPIIGNLMYTKEAYLKAGGYPEHHGFDTQAFGFRLLMNSVKVFIGNTFMYYQRLPVKPSYFVREAKSGNINRNWFFIFFECLYKFTPEVRKKIIEFSCSDARMLAKGRHLFNELADEANASNLFCIDNLFLDEKEAYDKYSNDPELTISTWCLGYEFRQSFYKEAFTRLNGISISGQSIKIIFPMIAQVVGKNLDDIQMQELRYFFSRGKPLTWRLETLLQRFLNRLRRWTF
jgi:glycosyltransferase involved in cell wall biosynthesis